jgi:hypothetical protein
LRRKGSSEQQRAEHESRGSANESKSHRIQDMAGDDASPPVA